MRHSAEKSPLLVVLALRGDEQNLSQKKKQEEEERENECLREVELSLLFTVPYERGSAEQRARVMALIKAKRKRKKRRKRKVPKSSSSRSSCGVRTRRCGPVAVRRPCDHAARVPGSPRCM